VVVTKSIEVSRESYRRESPRSGLLMWWHRSDVLISLDIVFLWR